MSPVVAESQIEWSSVEQHCSLAAAAEEDPGKRTGLTSLAGWASRRLRDAKMEWHKQDGKKEGKRDRDKRLTDFIPLPLQIITLY